MSVRGSRIGRAVAGFLSLWMALSVAAPAFAARRRAPQNAQVAQAPIGADKRTVLVFPLGKDQEVTGGPADLLATAYQSLLAAINRTATLAAVAPDPSSPLLQRAVREQRLKAQELIPPYTPETAVKIANEYPDAVVVAGTVSDYRYDASANKAEVSLSLQVIDPFAAQRQRLIAVTGTSKVQPTVGTEEALATEAAQDAAIKAAAQLAGTTPEAISEQVQLSAIAPGQPAQPTQQPAVRPRSRFHSGLLFLFAAAIIGLATSGGGAAALAAGGGTLPPPVPF